MKIKLHKDDSLRLQGLSSFFNKLAMLLLFPLRRPFVFIGILAVLYIMPVLIGVKINKVPAWYWFYIRHYFSTASDTVSQKAKEIIPEQITQVVISKPGEKVEIKPVVEKLNKPVKRRSFGKVNSEDIRKQDILSETDIERLPMAKKVVIVERKIILPQGATAETGGRKIINSTDGYASAAVAQGSRAETPTTASTGEKKLPLVYLDTPKEVSGKAAVLNANELNVNGEHLFLYGIYVDPNTTSGTEAKIFLNLLLEGKTVKCTINAYTYQNVATGICKVGDTVINQILVDKGFSKNVAL